MLEDGNKRERERRERDREKDRETVTQRNNHGILSSLR